jgi:hypothetical protein
MNPIIFAIVLIWFAFVIYLVWESGSLGTIIMAALALVAGWYFNSDKVLVILALLVPVLRLVICLSVKKFKINLMKNAKIRMNEIV